MDVRTGIGYDLHRFTADRPLILGGVNIPHSHGLLGHSDADVILHAVCDALLGAIGGPDIGALFPDDDPAWAGADSRVFVAEASRRVRAAGYRLSNVDLVIHAQTPRLGPHKHAIRDRLAEILEIAPDRVGVKATTNEGLDAIGRGEALACTASVLIIAVDH